MVLYMTFQRDSMVVGNIGGVYEEGRRNQGQLFHDNDSFLRG